MSHFKNVDVVSYNVVNWEAAKKFYGEVLDWPIIFADEGMGWVEYGVPDQAHISISRWDGPNRPPANGGGTAVLSVADAKAVTADLRARGVRCDDPVDIPGVVCYGTFYDPDGNRIQFASSNA